MHDSVAEHERVADWPARIVGDVERGDVLRNSHHRRRADKRIAEGIAEAVPPRPGARERIRQAALAMAEATAEREDRRISVVRFITAGVAGGARRRLPVCPWLPSACLHQDIPSRFNVLRSRDGVLREPRSRSQWGRDNVTRRAGSGRPKLARLTGGGYAAGERADG